MNISEQFDIFYADLGGRLNLNTWEEFFLDDSLIKEIESLQAALKQTSSDVTELIRKRGRTENVYISMTNHSSINGCCGITSDNNYLLSINIGVLIRLSLISQILWEVDSGNKEVFTSNDKEWIYHIFGYEYLDKNNGNELVKIKSSEKESELLFDAVKKVKSRLKDCKTPFYVTNLAVTFAVNFIVLHELHHVCYGHLNPKNPNKGSSNRLWESGTDLEKENFKTFQGFESLSDYGAGKVFGLRFKERAGLFGSFPLRLNDDIYCRLLSFSLKVCFSIISFDVSLLDAKHLYNTHPHPELRLLSFFDGVNDGINERPHGISNDWRNGLATGYWSVTKSFQDLQIFTPIMWSVTSNMQAFYNDLHFSPEVKRYIKDMNEYRLQSWKECEPYFLPFLSAYKSK